MFHKGFPVSIPNYVINTILIHRGSQVPLPPSISYRTAQRTENKQTNVHDDVLSMLDWSSLQEELMIRTTEIGRISTGPSYGCHCWNHKYMNYGCYNPPLPVLVFYCGPMRGYCILDMCRFCLIHISILIQSIYIFGHLYTNMILFKQKKDLVIVFILNPNITKVTKYLY